MPRALIPAACLVLFGLAACSESSAPAQRDAGDRTIKVVTQPIRLEPVVDEIQALGTARANESIEIRPRIASLVTRIAFEEGQVVEQGALLIELENSEILAGLELAKASLSAAALFEGRSDDRYLTYQAPRSSAAMPAKMATRIKMISI